MVSGSKGLSTQCLEPTTETSKNGLTKHISGSDGKAHSSEIFVATKTTCIIEIDEFKTYFHELSQSNWKE